jgi:hypothetical protein
VSPRRKPQELPKLLDDLEQVTAKIAVHFDDLHGRLEDVVHQIRVEYEDVHRKLENANEALAARGPRSGVKSGIIAALCQYIADQGPITIAEARDFLTEDGVQHSFAGVGVALANKKYFTRLPAKAGDRGSRYTLAEAPAPSAGKIARKRSSMTRNGKVVAAVRPDAPWVDDAP